MASAGSPATTSGPSSRVFSQLIHHAGLYRSAGHYRSVPIQTQPQWHNNSTSAYQDKLPKPTAVVPPGLTCLIEVEEVILKKKVFQTKAGQILFSVRQEAECCGPALNLRLSDPCKREVVSLYLDSNGECCGESYLRIDSLPAHPIGFVTIANTSKELNVSMQMENQEPVFSARLPIYLDSRCDNTIEILSVSGNHPVTTIWKEKEHKSSQVIFKFPMNLSATLKAVILGAFLYMTYRVTQLTTSSSTDDNGWAFNDSTTFGNDAGGGSDWGNDTGHCGGGDWGGGGDCGGGSSWDCGGGGEECGGGGGDCGGDVGDCGGGGGDCGDGGGGDCGGGCD